jgi:aspartyl-tRNA(Asn)/glutamyl-tRNA(Gln) amidotransferase subunit C
MQLPPEAIAHLAWLARLELGPDEARRLRRDLDGILEYVRVLEEVATEGAAADADASPAPPLREDEAGPGVAPEAALANAPERVGEFFAVPPVVERM